MDESGFISKWHAQTYYRLVHSLTVMYHIHEAQEAYSHKYFPY